MYTANEYRAEMQQVALESRAAGLAEGKVETAKNMLTAGLDINLVVSCTGLTETEVKALQQN